MKKPITAIIGAGQVGATAAQRLIEKNISNVVLFDIVEGLAEGKALDLMEAAPIEGHGRVVKGTTKYEDIAGADVVVITAGMPRKPGMTREDLLALNAKIVKSVCENVKKYAPDSIVITVTNPLDIMTDLAAKLLGFPKNRVFGMAGVLDSARMRYFISLALNVEPHRVSSLVLGGHGDLMVPVTSQMLCDGKPVTSISEADRKAIIERTQNGGAEIVKLLKTGSAFYAPASSVAQMVDAVLNDKPVALPVCAHCNGEYGVKDMYCGVVAKLGKNGIKEIVQIPLTPEEQKMLKDSVEKVGAGIREVAAMSF